MFRQRSAAVNRIQVNNTGKEHRNTKEDFFYMNRTRVPQSNPEVHINDSNWFVTMQLLIILHFIAFSFLFFLQSLNFFNWSYASNVILLIPLFSIFIFNVNIQLLDLLEKNMNKVYLVVIRFFQYCICYNYVLRKKANTSDNKFSKLFAISWINLRIWPLCGVWWVCTGRRRCDRESSWRTIVQCGVARWCR